MVAQPKPSFHTRLSTVARQMRVALSWARHGATALISHPEPQAIGSYARGRQIMAGNLMLAGALEEFGPDQTIWDVVPPSEDFARALHSFEWLEDLAAIGDAAARRRAQEWTIAWITHYGSGSGPGWTPALTGRRLVRMITQATLLLREMPAGEQAALFHNLTRQTLYLRKEWQRSPEGLPRIEALTGLIYAGLTLEGYEDLRVTSTAAMARTVASCVGADGGVPSRNPEELLEVFTLLGWTQSALIQNDMEVPPEIKGAIERIVPTLRALRHVDGQLARFHGGSGGKPGQLDRALVLSDVRAPATSNTAMGFATLHHGRTTVVVDASVPPAGAASAHAHASTLAFELASGAHSVIVNCGPGRAFGTEWTRAGRASASHSTLSLERYSSSRIGVPVASPDGVIEPLVQTPGKVVAQKTEGRKATALMLGHDGYVARHGLTHLRRLMLSVDGRVLEAEDSLRALSRADKAQFDRALDETALQGVPFHLRFHLHPTSEAEVDLGGRAVSIVLPNAETWIFRTGQDMKVTLQPSVYLDPQRLKPRATKQIVLSDVLVKYAATIDWTLTKA